MSSEQRTSNKDNTSTGISSANNNNNNKPNDNNNLTNNNNSNNNNKKGKGKKGRSLDKTRKQTERLRRFNEQNQQQEETLSKGEEQKPQIPEMPKEYNILDSEGYLLIDGTFKEGGGQIIRNTMALSVLTQKKIRIFQIRGNRNPGGLKSQHLTGVDLINQLSSGKLKNAYLGSTFLEFSPSQKISDQEAPFVADTRTAGSIGLLIQISMPMCLAISKPISIDFRGGTNVDFSPQVDYLLNTFQPIAAKMGLQNNTLKIMERGFFPKGGGRVIMQLAPLKEVLPIQMTKRGTISNVEIHCWASRYPANEMSKLVDAVKQHLKRKLTPDLLSDPDNENKTSPESPLSEDFFVVKLEILENAVGKEFGIILTANSSTGCKITSSVLGGKNPNLEKKAKDVAFTLAEELKHGGCVDEFLQDQLIIL